ncbi:unnamed protein product [Effrenium voratum]|nr:unnamed protein product [Effrenium voratum]
MFNGDVGYCMTEMLLQHGARPSSTKEDLDIDPPLHGAAKRGCAPAMALLLRARADPDEVNAQGDSPLHLACRQTPFQPSDMQNEVVSLLLSLRPSHGAMPLAVDASGNTPRCYVHERHLQEQLQKAEGRWSRWEALRALRSSRQSTKILPELVDNIVSFF